MRRLNLAATLTGCAMCTILVVGATFELQPCYTDACDFPAEASMAAVDASTIAIGKTDVADALKFALAMKEAEEQAKAESEAAQKAAEEAEKQAAEEAAAKTPSAKSTPIKKSQNAGKAASAKSTPPAVKKSGTAAPAQSQNKSCTITVNGVPIDYIDSYGTSAAPSNDAGIWYGSDSTTDGSFGYFIGHNYTDFGAVADLENGSSVSVTDGDGNSREYEVVDSFVVPRGTTWDEVSDRVTGYGESIAMQTCVNDGYVIVVAT